MNNKILLSLIITLAFQCSPKDSGREMQNGSDTVQVETNVSEQTDTAKSNQAYLTCQCDWELQAFNSHTDLGFSDNSIQHPFNSDSLSKWKNNPERLKIRSLGLTDFDTIPADLRIFENVESVYLLGMGKRNVQGLEIFPKLRILKAEAVIVEFERNSKWLQKIEVIHVNKTRFFGITSFGQLPNLREVRMTFSGFDSFPADFETLKCLTYFQSGATSGEIDLTKLNVINMKCLSYLEFHSWEKNIKGIPTGIDHIETVKVSHANLTKGEKAKLKRIRRKKL